MKFPVITKAGYNDSNRKTSKRKFQTTRHLNVSAGDEGRRCTEDSQHEEVEFVLSVLYVRQLGGMFLVGVLQNGCRPLGVDCRHLQLLQVVWFGWKPVLPPPFFVGR